MQQNSSRLPVGIQFETRRGKVSATKVGPSLRGYVYRWSEAGLYFRLIPIDDIPTLAQRRAVADRVNLPRQPMLAPVVDAGDTRIGRDLYYYVAYEVPNDRSLVDLLDSLDDRDRLMLISRVVSALPIWWQRISEGIIPMPADVVLAEQQWPTLLALPPNPEWWPRLESLVAEPERIYYLAPELVRGNRNQFSYRAVDVYACAVTALRSLFLQNSNERAEILLRKAASGTLLELEKQTCRIPSWLRSFGPFLATCQSISIALASEPRHRANVDLAKLATELSTLVRYTDPLEAAEVYQTEGRYADALALLEEASLMDERSELFLTAACLAEQHLDDPVQAIEFYERAINRGAGQKAFQGQLTILVKAVDVIRPLMLVVPQVGERLGGMVLRDFHSLPKQEQSVFVLDVAGYLMEAKRFIQARQVLYPHLYEGTIYLWWEFGRTLMYAEALIEEGQILEAQPFLEGIKLHLSEVGRYRSDDPRRLDDALFGEHVQKMVNLEERLRKKLYEKGG